MIRDEELNLASLTGSQVRNLRRLHRHDGSRNIGLKDRFQGDFVMVLNLRWFDDPTIGHHGSFDEHLRLIHDSRTNCESETRRVVLGCGDLYQVGSFRQIGQQNLAGFISGPCGDDNRIVVWIEDSYGRVLDFRLTSDGKSQVVGDRDFVIADRFRHDSQIEWYIDSRVVVEHADMPGESQQRYVVGRIQ